MTIATCTIVTTTILSRHLYSRGAGLSSYLWRCSFLPRQTKPKPVLKWTSVPLKPTEALLSLALSQIHLTLYSPLLCRHLYLPICCIIHFTQVFTVSSVTLCSSDLNRKHQITSELSVFTEMCYLHHISPLILLFCRPSVTKISFSKWHLSSMFSYITDKLHIF